ncbi:MAG: hypothetical protein WCW87_00210 [Candidatus Paceibacterota bacterium]
MNTLIRFLLFFLIIFPDLALSKTHHSKTHYSEPQKKSEQIIKNNDEYTYGRATNFGFEDPKDLGIGSFVFNREFSPYKGVNTNKSDIKGVALPQIVIEKKLGIPHLTENQMAADREKTWKIWETGRMAGVEVIHIPTGKKLVVPIVDFGPGFIPQKLGVVIDLAEGTKRDFGFTQRFMNESGFKYRIIPNYFLEKKDQQENTENQETK